MAGFDEVYLDSQFENGSDGTVYENEVYRWATTTVDGNPESLKRAGGLGDPNGYLNIEFGDYGDDKETYRWNNLIVNNRTRDDYSEIIQLNKALSLSGDELDAATQQIMDVDQWMRTAAYQGARGSGRCLLHGFEHSQLPPLHATRWQGLIPSLGLGFVLPTGHASLVDRRWPAVTRRSFAG